MKWRQLIGTKAFYTRLFQISIPLMIQQGITTFVSLLDNIMVGQIGTAAINGVTVANQVMFIVYIIFFGGLAGPGIFFSQFFGANDEKNMREVFRIKIIFTAFIALLSFAIILLLGGPVLSAYLKDSEAIQNGRNYLTIMLFNVIPFGITTLYSTSLREIGETKIPMIAGLGAVAINFVLNYLFIFGVQGWWPPLGVQGAAIATVFARLSELLVIVLWTHRKHFAFSQKIFQPFTISSRLMSQTLLKTVPLLANELIWSFGTVLISFAYSLRGDLVVASLSIANTIANLMFVIFGALATSFAVLVGNELGANKLAEAKQNAYQLIAFALATAVVLSAIVALFAPFFPRFYKVEPQVQQLATQLLWIINLAFPVYTFNVSCFFILRAGGSAIQTFLFDSFFSVAVVIPIALSIGFLTTIPIFPMYLIVQSLELFKSLLGWIFLRQGKWIRNLSLEHQGGKIAETT